jgi:NADPH2:quinone reductase
MNQTMKAVVLTGTGGPEALSYQEVPLSWPGRDDDVLVRLAAAALNPADIYFRRMGTYVQGEQPCILGHDGAGEVLEVGPGVRNLRPGDRVCFCNGGIGADPGTYAEYAIVPEALAVRIHPKVDFCTAAALPLVAITAWEALYERAAITSAEPVLIHAGAGGTGQIAIQLAKLRGAQVATTVSTPAKAKVAQALGADLVIAYHEEDFVSAVLGWTKGNGASVALDNVGGDALHATFRAMAPYGRVVTLKGMPEGDGDWTAYNRNLTIHNIMMLTPMWLGLAERRVEQAKYVAKAMTLVADGQLRVTISARFPLAKAATAQEYLASGAAVGKVVLEIPGDPETSS